MGHKILLTTTILLISLINLSPRTLAGTEILDTDGNPLVAGSRYYILTSGRGAAGRGGVTPTIIRSSSVVPCPKYVAQFSSEWEKGRPVSFFPSDPNQKEITEETEVNISFGLDPYCRSLMVWQLNFEEIGAGSYIPFITTNGVIGNPEAETFNNWFQIEKIDKFGSYRIVYCFVTPVPASGQQGKEGKSCEQIDATIPGSNGLNYLSLVPIENSLPFFGFVFKKVEDDVITASV